jgi:hypothetical protein
MFHKLSFRIVLFIARLVSKWLFKHKITYLLLIDHNGTDYFYGWHGDAKKLLGAATTGLKGHMVK